MSDFSQEQVEKRAAIQKSASIIGVIVALIVGLVAYWILGSQNSGIRIGGSAVVALVAGFLVHRASFNSGAKSAKCANCGAAFSRSRTDRTEVLDSSSREEESETQEDGSTKVTTWIEEVYDVTETYTCSTCQDETTKTYKSNRRTGEEEKVIPAPKPAAAKGGQKTSGGDAEDAAPSGKKRSRSSRR